MPPDTIQKDLAEIEAELARDPVLRPILEMGSSTEDPASRLGFYLDVLSEYRDIQEDAAIYRESPVDAETFLDHPDFLGNVVRLWPKLKTEIVEACSGKYTEAVFTGSIGVGKSTAALVVQLYFLYQVLLLRDPHRAFDMDPSSEIAFVLQSVTGGTAFTVDYMRLRRMLEATPWFSENAPHERERKAVVQFRDWPIMIQPLPGTETAAIGENVMGGVIDEVNHMKVIFGSSRSKGGGVWDQMLENYRAIARRRESRFQRNGKVPGMLCLVGSANYAGQFTDRKKAERDEQLARTGKTNIYIYDKRPWEVQPEDRFSPERFRVFLGDGSRRPRILHPSEPVPAPDAGLIMEIPTDQYDSFAADLPGALKDIAGVVPYGERKFIPNRLAIAKAFGQERNVFDPGWCDFAGQPARIVKFPIPNPTAPRYIHIDLSLNIDNAGLAMGHVSGFEVVDRGGGLKETLPVIRFDGLLSIQPSGGLQIPIHKIKELVFVLRNSGYPVKWVTLDGFQSADFIQTMGRSGVRSGILSLDRTATPYMTAKTAILDGRVHGPDHPLIREELGNLVWIPMKAKVDHLPGGSKDLADPVAGVIHGLTMRREIWASHGINPRSSARLILHPDESGGLDVADGNGHQQGATATGGLP